MSSQNAHRARHAPGAQSLSRGPRLHDRGLSTAIVALLPQYFLESRGRHRLPASHYPCRGITMASSASPFAWQVLFLIMGARSGALPARHAARGPRKKLAFGGRLPSSSTCKGRLAALIFGAGIVDLVFVALFIFAFSRNAGIRHNSIRARLIKGAPEALSHRGHRGTQIKKKARPSH